MLFSPQVGDQLNIETATYCVAEHPVAPGIPYGQEGRAAIVYQLLAASPSAEESQQWSLDCCALKVFKPRYRSPSLVTLASRLASFANLPGLAVCQRSVLTPQGYVELLRQHPGLTYAVLMPWVEGPTWMEVMLEKWILAPQQSLNLARSLAEILVGMEQRCLAHCDLSGSNMLLPALAGKRAEQQGDERKSAPSQVALVDVEEIYGPGLERPREILSGSPGYAHRTAQDGIWGVEADRFAGAILIVEILGWYDERVRDAAWGEGYFGPDEMQQDSERYRLLVNVLKERWSRSIVALLERAWRSETLAGCPTLGEWLMVLESQSSGRLRVDQKEKIPMEQQDAKERFARASVEKAEAMIAMGQTEDALKELEGAYRLSPELVAEGYARALVQYAGQREDTGDTKGALKSYRQALQVAPHESVFWQEIVAVANRLEAQLTKGKITGGLVLQTEVSTGKVILWFVAILVGWAGILVAGAALSTKLVHVGWAVAGGLVGLVQWLVMRRDAPMTPWWVLVSAAGWLGCSLLGQATANGMFWSYLEGWYLGGERNQAVAIWRTIAWQFSFLLNVAFSVAAAMVLFRRRPMES